MGCDGGTVVRRVGSGPGGHGFNSCSLHSYFKKGYCSIICFLSLKKEWRIKKGWARISLKPTVSFLQGSRIIRSYHYENSNLNSVASYQRFAKLEVNVRYPRLPDAQKLSPNFPILLAFFYPTPAFT